ncbi:MAG TPA: hypothetical protein VIQ05_07400 [Tardiphaga sp.]
MLNSTLFLLFGAATIADRWPGFAMHVGVLAFAVVAIEAAVFWRFVKQRNERDDISRSEVNNIALDHSNSYLDTKVQADMFLMAPNLLMSSFDIHERRLLAHLRHRHQQEARHVLAAWALAHVREERFQYLNIVKEMERRRPITELEKLKVVAHSNDAFNIVAGAFEIEFFHGRTNIRVLDSSKVTVEGATRGEKVAGLLPGIPTPTYQ